ncbi:methionine/alanine import family NSS transporter small subunit [Oceanobacillus profundus]|uniref:Methionine/alanine import family NSS transporter small subunit n=1 Tax=Oceanobacillus profundus TaxID=372463 RepID=A0A417YML2_9BACI|nr:methionine/alanine import family NSS transporter small subunit [Oceanobacillus profundus]MBR3120987.1 methionine/alanine import family NSS transporter small subunit [Oceanobacillus sp.]MCM3399099.1 methionine/alanine import family NSS transporter small subunit [Oceanobacillus profundus]MDO6449120.1 methionine/alanine import family NSS transporter small subunit [Oceanobacillus profundus]RHW34543.1 methionine/alanine import family NSS transporter small subunit [Oceanobacillus profundus]
MSGASIFVMVIGMIIIWGGLIASVWNAMRKSKQTD